MKLITTTEALDAWCAKAKSSPILCVDTEFMREKTYFPQLCLIQIATETDSAMVDPLVEGMYFDSFYDLLEDTNIVKIFHAAWQDLEILYRDAEKPIRPVFDTQVAAMVCGYGESCSYAKLVQGIHKVRLEKGSQFTDWSRRPLTDMQMEYALGDVTYLPKIYHTLKDQLTQLGRESWIEEEMAVVNDPKTFEVTPENAWKKIKLRSREPRFVGIVQKLAAWREVEAQKRDHPRQWVIKDDAISEIAAMQPKDMHGLRALRGTRSNMSDNTSQKILDLLQEVFNTPLDQLPQLDQEPQKPHIPPAVADLLRILLKDCADKADVATRLIASMDELDELAVGRHEGLPCLQGWRHEVFGQHALQLVGGKLALTATKRGLKLIAL